MFADLRVSLYELFGHVVPGTVFLAAAVTASWTAFYSRDPLEPGRLMDVPWYATLLLAYLAGLGAQAIAGLVEGRFGARLGVDLVEASLRPELKTVVGKARQLLDAELGLDFGKADLDWLFRVCDEALAQSDRTPDRESYRYREGLFRGLAVALLVLGAAIVARAVVPDAAFRVDGTTHPAETDMLLILAAGALGAAILSFLRFRDIRQKRFARVIAGFIVQRSLGPESMGGDRDPT